MFRRFWPLLYLKTQNASYLYENSTVLRDLSCKIHLFATAFHNQLEWEEMVENWLHNVAKCTFWACFPPTISPHPGTHCKTPWMVSEWWDSFTLSLHTTFVLNYVLNVPAWGMPEPLKTSHFPRASCSPRKIIPVHIHACKIISDGIERIWALAVPPETTGELVWASGSGCMHLYR